MTMERPMMSMPAMPTMPANAGMNMMMMPRCSMQMEKCKGGMMMTCTADSAMATGMMQNLCQMMNGSMVSCCMMMNGMMMMTCNLTMGMCKCEMTKTGMMITCTSGDKACCDMIQACCDAMMAMMKGGCTCCVCMNGTPVCCGTC